MSETTDIQTFKMLCENDFSFYCQQYLKVIEPETIFDWNWHHETLCHYCERVYYGELQNLDINISPRTLKSLIVSVLFPTWIWTKRPSFKIMSASSTYDLSNKFNIKRRELIESEAYQCLWPTKMKEYANTIQKFENISNGFMAAYSAGGSVTGSGADLLLSDDLLDVNNAFSKTEREKINNWYSNAYYNRAQNKKTVMRININQRLHSDDLSGYLRKSHNFDRLIIPMVRNEINESTVDFQDPREIGELLHPARYGESEMLDDMKSLGTYGWSSQYQQSPVPVGGGIIKEEWIRYYDRVPDEFQRKIITADLNFKGGEQSDYVSFQCWGRFQGNRYLLDIIRGKWTYKETKDHFKAFCEKNKCDRKWIEEKANGAALISDMSPEIHGLKGWPEKGSSYMNATKVQRLHMVSQDFENGLVYIPSFINLANEYVKELVSFTEKGSTIGTDDLVDTSTMALIELRKSETFAMG